MDGGFFAGPVQSGRLAFRLALVHFSVFDFLLFELLRTGKAFHFLLFPLRLRGDRFSTFAEVFF